MSLWVLSIIRCSIFTLLSDVGHITHTCTQQHSHSSVSPSIQHAIPSSGNSYFACIVVATQGATWCLYRCCCFLRNYLAASVVPFVEPGLWCHCWVIRGARWQSTSRLEQPHKQDRRHTLTQNLRQLETLTLPVSSLLHKEPLDACTVVAAFCATIWRPRSYPSSNQGSDATVGSLGELGDSPHRG